METQNPNIKLHEGRNIRLGYAREFKRMVHEYPGILRTAMDLAQRAETEYKPPKITIGAMEFSWNPDITKFELMKIGNEDETPPRRTYGQMVPLSRGVILVPGETLRDEITGLEVTVLGRTKREFAGRIWGTGNVFRIDESAYFKMELEDKVFCVKKSNSTDNPGYDEFKNGDRVLTALSSMENIAIVEAQLGYSDDNQSWFVSKWKDLESQGFFPLNAYETGSPNDYGQLTEYEEQLNFTEEEIIATRGRSVGDEIKRRLEE